MINYILPPDEKVQILDKLNDWLSSIYSYKKPPAHICDSIERDSNYFRIDVGKKKYRLYLRFGKTWVSEKQKSIVIAQICFEKTRSGYGTSLLRLLTEIAKQYDYQVIAIESVNENSRAFALNYGFSEHNSNNDYVISVNKLESVLETKNKFDYL